MIFALTNGNYGVGITVTGITRNYGDMNYGDSLLNTFLAIGAVGS